MPKLSPEDYWTELTKCLGRGPLGGSPKKAPVSAVTEYRHVWDVVEPTRVTILRFHGDGGLLGGKGRHVLNMTTNFRGFPPEGSRSRYVPWFVLAPADQGLWCRLPQQWSDVQQLSRYNRNRSIDAERVPGLPFDLWMSASHDPVFDALHTATWLDRWRRWHDLSPQGGPKNEPAFFGVIGEAVLSLRVDPAREVQEYADVLPDFVKVVDRMEEEFGAPLLSELPPQIQVDDQSQHGGWELISYTTVYCPRCRAQHRIVFGGNPTYNVACLDCRGILFAGPTQQPPR